MDLDTIQRAIDALVGKTKKRDPLSSYDPNLAVDWEKIRRQQEKVAQHAMMYGTAMQKSAHNIPPGITATQAPFQPQPTQIHITAPLGMKAERALAHFNVSISYNIAARISRATFNREDTREGGRLYFEVMFDNGHAIKFYDIDTFPSDADLGRVALECP